MKLKNTSQLLFLWWHQAGNDKQKMWGVLIHFANRMANIKRNS